MLQKLIAQIAARWPRSYAWPARDIMLAGGQRLHLVGSIHMGTQDMQPLPGGLITQLQRADALIVEADITQGASPFSHRETDRPLSERLSDEQLAHFTRLCDELGLSATPFMTLPAWQIALTLQAQQAQRLGLRPQYGIDYQLLQIAGNTQKRIIELESPEEQLQLLRNLPEGGLALLSDTLEHWHTNARLLQLMIGWWMQTPPKEVSLTLPGTFSSELNDVLMNARNQRWCRFLQQLPAGHYVVAVGALHLYGECNLLDLLKNR